MNHRQSRTRYLLSCADEAKLNNLTGLLGRRKGQPTLISSREAAKGLTKVKAGKSRVKVSLYLIMPDNRKRDIDNVLKAVLDAIGHAEIYHDDSQVDELHVVRGHVEPPGCVDVIIQKIETKK